MSFPPSRYHGNTTQADMSREDWERCWETGKTYFHNQDKHFLLVKHIDQLIDGRHMIKIFVPWCGKSVDMKWLYDLGHVVVGVDGSKLAVECFFKENSIEHTVCEASLVNGTCYKSIDDRLHLYCCDMFDYNREAEGLFDGMWDRGGFGSANVKDRTRYSALIQSLMSDSCRMLVDSFVYDEKLYIGPPGNVDPEVFDEFFGAKCDVRILETVDMLTPERAKLGSDNLKHFDEQLRLISPK